ncbi:MAG: hypothetical protein U0X39_12230 [Bacteroidales bacterium]
MKADLGGIKISEFQTDSIASCIAKSTGNDIFPVGDLFVYYNLSVKRTGCLASYKQGGHIIEVFIKDMAFSCS